MGFLKNKKPLKSNRQKKKKKKETYEKNANTL